MLHPQHVQKSLERLAKSDSTGLYSLAPKIVEEIVHEVHGTFDEHHVRTGNPIEDLKHRAFLHHQEGIRQITKMLTKEYGKTYKDLIRQEAQQHVKDDMGYIPRKEEYSQKNFWQNWSERNETLPNV